MSKLFFSTVFSLALLQGIAAQDFEQTLGLAGHYHEMGMHELASRHYRRVIFFGNDSIQASVYPRIAESQLLAGNYTESIFFFTLASNTSKSDSLRAEYSFRRVLAYILMEQYDFALQQLYSVPDTSRVYFRRKAHFYHGVIALHKEEEELARQLFCRAARDSIQIRQVEQYFDLARLDRPDPGKARKLSMFFPGLGQAYAGDTRGALNSFLLIGGLGALSFYTAINYSFLEGAVSIMPWLVRYYLGGFQHAETTAMAIRDEKYQELFLEILTVFSPADGAGL